MRVNVFEELTNWATSSEDMRLAVLYGRRGSGKTVTTQEIEHRLRAMRGSKAPRWESHYFPLRHCAFPESSVPAIEKLLTESIRRHWRSEGDLPTGQSILANARRKPTLFIVDGFDWLTTQFPRRHWPTLMHELLKLAPYRVGSRGWQGPWAGNDAKVLLALGPEHESLVHTQYSTAPIKELLLDPL